MIKGWSRWLSWILILALLAGCGDAGNYIKENYTLIDVQGSGKSISKVYSVQDKDVPAVAAELAENEAPQEISPESQDQMFLIYSNKIVHVQKDPANEGTTLVEVNSIEYARNAYDSSFLQGYLTASILQSVFGGGWYGSSRGYDYRGYTSTKRYEDYGKYRSVPYPSAGGSTTAPPATKAPSTSDRKGSYTTPSTPAKPPASGNVRRSDGSSPTYKSPSTSKSSTSKRSGSFRRK